MAQSSISMLASETLYITASNFSSETLNITASNFSWRGGGLNMKKRVSKSHPYDSLNTYKTLIFVINNINKTQ